MRPIRRCLTTALAALALLPLATACTGGADAVITGFGNNGNLIGVDVLERLAKELARLEPLPVVSDDELRSAWSAIRQHALAGDPDASLVLLRVAALQRTTREQ